jgi:hypothetical protein
MQERYGLDRRPVGRRVAVAVLVVAFVAVLAFVTFGQTRNPIEFRLVAYEQASPDRIDATLSITRPADREVVCVLRAQDRTYVDVGYATVVIPPGEGEVLLDYSMRTLAPALGMELLGCALDGPPGVTPAQFPPGVVPPPQPY